MIRRAIGLLFAATGASALSAGAPGFPGTNTGTIPDGNPSGLSVQFTVSGLFRPVGNVGIAMDLTHNWAGDLNATLISPDGRARLLVFGRLGASRSSNFGDSSNFGGSYTFWDSATVNLWQSAVATGDAAIPPGTYRTLSAGSPGRSMLGGCPTSLRGVFQGLTPEQANGVWTLLMVDAATPDAGSINAATLYLDMVPDGLFIDGFETGIFRTPEAPDGVITPVDPRCYNKPFADLTGDGLSDFVMVHNNAGSAEWTVLPNNGNGTAAAALPVFTLGTFTGYVDLFDVDGDRIADPAAWSAGNWMIRPSSRSGGEVWTRSFGQASDDPRNSGDFDGDAVDDLTIVRKPPSAPPELHILSSYYGWTYNIALGAAGTAYVSAGFDLSGDAMVDALVQRGSGGAGDFTIYTGFASVYQNFVLGTPSDVVCPGNYSGDFIADTTVARGSAGNIAWETRDGGSGVVQPIVTFGLSASDFSVLGDYDGDGLSDYAVWRPSPGPSQFLMRPSTNTATFWGVTAGLNGDYPVANSRVR
ncbi:MAG: proprotein convertase P-domain-containing protein [Xanthomonadales bacterium]|nr:proprotein convertase P-domain-containing protein [Xanthomonadales bacterium]